MVRHANLLFLVLASILESLMVIPGRNIIGSIFVCAPFICFSYIYFLIGSKLGPEDFFVDGCVRNRIAA